MNRFQLLIIGVVIIGLFVIVIGTVIVSKDNRKNIKRIENLENTKVVIEHKVDIDMVIDSVMNALETEKFLHYDSVITSLSEMNEKLSYRIYVLRQKDKEHEKVFDSLSSLIPSLPDW